MANEISHGTLQTNGGQVASVLSDMVFQQLFDATDLRQLMQFHDVDNYVGSDTVDVTKDAVPAAAAAATSETVGGQSNTAYTTSKFQLAWARYVLQYEMTDLLAINGGPIGMQRVIDKLQVSIGLTLTDGLTALFPSLSNSVTPGSGIDLDVDTIYAAQFQLNNSLVPGDYACVLYPEQFNNFQQSLRSEPGAVQFQQATADMLRLSGPGFKGSWNGIRFFQSDSVTAVDASANSSGAMFGFGCFGYTLRNWRRIQQNMMISPSDVLADFGVGFVERNRDATNGMSEAILNLYPAWVEQEDARGVEIVSDR